MSDRIRETLKTIILLVLIITSLLQVGILWSYQSHGFPTNFLAAIFPRVANSPEEMDELAREEYFQPFRIIAYRDEDSRLLFDNDNEYYDSIWAEAQEYIRQALYHNDMVSLPYSLWGELITKRSFIIEFKSPLPSNLVKWFLNIQTNEEPKIEDIHKIMIAPSESGNRSYNTVYILGDKTLYRMIVPFWSQGMNREKYEGLFYSLDDSKADIYNMFYVTGFTFDIPPDTLFVIGNESNQLKKFNTLRYTIPEDIMDNDLLTRILLDNKRESYDRTEDLNGTIIFQNLRNIYKIYSNGLLEHRYIPSSWQSDKGSISEAFTHVHRFLRDVKDVFLPNTDIYICGVHESGTGYTFELGYIVDGKPVYIETASGVGNAITITANAKRILSCKWTLRDIQQERMVNVYDVNFISFANNMVDIYGDIIPNISVRDIMEGYLLKPDKNNNIEPVWLVKTGVNEAYSVPMKRGELF